jgi:hypothetical protein
MASTFAADFGFSRGQREVADLETLQAMIPGCVSVTKTGEDQDRRHIDYVANLRRGTVLHIDAKTRRAGASRYWKRYEPGRQAIPTGEPDLAIELWSVTGSDGGDVVGWTLDESSDTDLILYTFDPTDTHECFLLSFQLLRIAARAQYRAWSRRFGQKTQRTLDACGRTRWESLCCLVPACVVQDAIRAVERWRPSCRWTDVPNSHPQQLPLVLPTAEEIFGPEK